MLDSVEQPAFLILYRMMKGCDVVTSIGIRLPNQEKKALAVIACQNDMTISQVLRRLIREYLDDVSQAKRASCQTCAASGAFATYQEEGKDGDVLPATK